MNRSSYSLLNQSIFTPITMKNNELISDLSFRENTLSVYERNDYNKEVYSWWSNTYIDVTQRYFTTIKGWGLKSPS